MGYLTSTLVFRGDLTGDPSFAALLAAARRTVLDALDHGDVPFERVIGDLGLPREARNLLMPTMFILHAPYLRTPARNTGATDGGPRPGFADLTDTQFDPEILQPKFDLALEGWRDDDGLLLVLHYDTGLLPEEVVAGDAARFELLLAGIAAAPDRRLSALPLLTDAERTALAASAHGPAAPDACADVAVPPVPASFAATAARTPAAPAVTCGAETLSYAGLQALADRLAAGLARTDLAGAGPGEVVGVCLPRSPAAIAAPFAVWRAGAATCRLILPILMNGLLRC